MQEKETIVIGENKYEIGIIINNTAYIISETGKTGVLNIKKRELIGNLDYFYTVYDRSGEFFIQRKTIKNTTANKGKTYYTLRFYDAKKEKLIADGWKLIKQFDGIHLNEYDWCAVESPIGGKIHLFDQAHIRSNINMFNIGLDNVELLYNPVSFKHLIDRYLVVTKSGKKGFYASRSGLKTPIAFDEVKIEEKNAKHYLL